MSETFRFRAFDRFSAVFMTFSRKIDGCRLDFAGSASFGHNSSCL